MSLMKHCPAFAPMVLFLICGGWGCGGASEEITEGDTVPRKTLTEVQDAHTDSLMALPGVVGIYQGQTEKGQPCLKIMVIRRTRTLEEAIPGELEGYPVVIEESGEIRPLDGGS